MDTTRLTLRKLILNRENPYPGLQAFSEYHDSFFYGRDRERDEPHRGGRTETRRTAAVAREVLDRDERDRETDHRLHHRFIRSHRTENAERESDAVPDREAGHQQDDLTHAPAKKQQREQKSEMVETCQNVLDAEDQIVEQARHRRCRPRGVRSGAPGKIRHRGGRIAGEIKRAILRRKHTLERASVAAAHACNMDVGRRCLEESVDDDIGIARTGRTHVVDLDSQVAAARDQRSRGTDFVAAHPCAAYPKLGQEVRGESFDIRATVAGDALEPRRFKSTHGEKHAHVSVRYRP